MDFSAITSAVTWPVGFFDSDPVTGVPGVGVADPAWRDRLQPASFRNVPFYVEEAGSEGGRRWQHFEFPLRDLPFSEDMGRLQRKWSLRAYILGSEYMGTRDRLLAACETPGPGKLVHPFLGELTVCCDAYRLSEREEEGGICYFDLAFAESAATAAPDVLSAPGAAMRSASSGLLGSVSSQFSGVWKATGVQDFVTGSALRDLKGFGSILQGFGIGGLGSSKISTLLRMLPSSLSGASVSKMVTQGVGMVAGASSVTKAISGLGVLSRLRFPVGGGTAASAPAPASSSRSSRAAVPAVETPATPSRVQEALNSAALGDLVNMNALAALADPLARVPLDSYEALATLREAILDAFDALAERAFGDTATALAALRVALIHQLAVRGASLRALRRYTTASPQPSVVLATRLYQDMTRGPELVARTRAVHPGFLPLEGLVAAV